MPAKKAFEKDRWTEFNGVYGNYWALQDKPAFRRLPNGAAKIFPIAVEEMARARRIEVKIRRVRFASGRKVFFLKSPFDRGVSVAIGQEEIAEAWAAAEELGICGLVDRALDELKKKVLAAFAEKEAALNGQS